MAARMGHMAARMGHMAARMGHMAVMMGHMAVMMVRKQENAAQMDVVAKLMTYWKELWFVWGFRKSTRLEVQFCNTLAKFYHRVEQLITFQQKHGGLFLLNEDMAAINNRVYHRERCVQDSRVHLLRQQRQGIIAFELHLK
jgi:hypothetical protein